MGGKQGDSSKGKEQPGTPSTGRGAASALDALIKRRVPTPGQAQQQQVTKQKKH
jgi:hypothetical protein